jgi:phage-related baseplate assembly protein
VSINVNRFIAPTINPANLPVPDTIEMLDQETILSDRMTDFQARADQAGFPYDVGGLEFDPVKIDQEAHAHREMLMRARVNSAVRAVLPAYAQGADLDAIVARANVQRLVLTPADPTNGTPAVVESDQALLVRYLTSFAVPACGSEDGYIYNAILAYPGFTDIAVLGPGVHGVDGRAAVYLLGPDGVPPSADIVETVRAALHQDFVKPLTDDVIVGAAEVLTYAVSLRVTVPRGPAPATIVDAATKAVRAVADARYGIGVKVYANALEGAAYVGNVLRVERLQPLSDVLPGPSQAAWCMSVQVVPVIEDDET